MSILNNIFSCIYIPIINDAEKCRITHKMNKMNIDFKLFDGIYGKKYKEALSNDFLTPGEWGHNRTFAKIITNAIENKYDRILILEPDIYFCKNFEIEIEKWWNTNIIKNTTNYDLIYLGCSQGSYYRENTWEIIDTTINSDNYNTYKTLGTFAVSISSNIYEKYINLLNKKTMTSDICLTKLQENCTGIVIYPNLICCDVTNSATSNRLSIKKYNANIQKDRIRKCRWNRVYDFVDNLRLNYLSEKSGILGLKIEMLDFTNDWKINITYEDKQLQFRTLNIIRTISKENIIFIKNIKINKKISLDLETENCWINTCFIIVNKDRINRKGLSIVKNTLYGQYVESILENI